MYTLRTVAEAHLISALVVFSSLLLLFFFSGARGDGAGWRTGAHERRYGESGEATAKPKSGKKKEKKHTTNKEVFLLLLYACVCHDCRVAVAAYVRAHTARYTIGWRPKMEKRKFKTHTLTTLKRFKKEGHRRRTSSPRQPACSSLPFSSSTAGTGRRWSVWEPKCRRTASRSGESCRPDEASTPSR